MDRDRCTVAGCVRGPCVAISASEVRRRLANKDLVALAGLVPAPTLALLTTKVQADRPRAELVPAAVG